MGRVKKKKRKINKFDLLFQQLGAHIPMFHQMLTLKEMETQPRSNAMTLTIRGSFTARIMSGLITTENVQKKVR